MNAFYIALNVFIFICYAILVLCIIGCIAGVLLGIIKKEYKSKRVRDAAFFFIIMLVTFAATLLKPQKYVSRRTIQKCVEHVSTST